MVNTQWEAYQTHDGKWHVDFPEDGVADVIGSRADEHALLIAAAPELLAALEELNAACKKLPASDGRIIGLLPIINRAHDAIAKAKGVPS